MALRLRLLDHQLRHDLCNLPGKQRRHGVADLFVLLSARAALAGCSLSFGESLHRFLYD